MAAFYNQGDQNIYKDFKYVPQERYRLGYTPPVQGGGQDASTPSFGIPNTNAFTNSGGDDFNPAGNAFGYGTPVSEVNVRTFNPQSNDPTGSVANAQGIYNQSAQALGSGYSPSYTDGSMAGKSLSEIQSMANNQIMDNRQNYQANYNSPYDDTVDLGYKGRDTSTSIQRNRGKLSKVFDFVTDFIPGVGAVKRGAKFIKGMLPDNPNGPGGGTYGVGGLSNAQKEAYNTLAKQGMLFSGSSGMKTSTGKNFTGKGYMEGQRSIFNEMTAKGYGIDEDGNVTLNGVPLTNKQNFNKLKFKESSALFKDRLAKQKTLREAEKNRLTGLIGTRGTDRNTGTTSTIQGEGGGNTAGTSRASDHGNAAGLGHNAGNVREANAAGKGSAQGHNQNLKSGGRAGYFFGGRVNFKDGGLASIL